MLIGLSYCLNLQEDHWCKKSFPLIIFYPQPDTSWVFLGGADGLEIPEETWASSPIYSLIINCFNSLKLMQRQFIHNYARIIPLGIWNMRQFSTTYEVKVIDNFSDILPEATNK